MASAYLVDMSFWFIDVTIRSSDKTRNILICVNEFFCFCLVSGQDFKDQGMVVLLFIPFDADYLG